METVWDDLIEAFWYLEGTHRRDGDRSLEWQDKGGRVQMEGVGLGQILGGSSLV